MALAIGMAATVGGTLSSAVARAGVFHWSSANSWIKDSAANWANSSRGAMNNWPDSSNAILEGDTAAPVTTIAMNHSNTSTIGDYFTGSFIAALGNSGPNITNANAGNSVAIGSNIILAITALENNANNTNTHAADGTGPNNLNSQGNPAANGTISASYGAASILKNMPKQSYSAYDMVNAIYGNSSNLKYLTPQNSANATIGIISGGPIILKNQPLNQFQLNNAINTPALINAAQPVTFVTKVTPHDDASNASEVTLSGGQTDANNATPSSDAPANDARITSSGTGVNSGIAPNNSIQTAAVTLSGINTTGKNMAVNSATVNSGTNITALLAMATVPCPGGLVDPWYDSASVNAGTWNASGALNWSSTQASPSYSLTWQAAANANGDPTGGSNSLATFQGTAGTVNVSGAVSVGAITFTTDGYTLGGTGTLTFGSTMTLGSTITTSGGTDTINTILNGTLGLIKAGTGTLTLGSLNTYTGGTTINAGTLKMVVTVASGNTDHFLGNIFIGSSGTLELFNSGGGTAFEDGGTAITGTGILTKTGTGVYDLKGTGDIKNFAGLIDIQAGQLLNQTSDWNTSAGNMSLNVGINGIFDLRTNSAVINNLTGSGVIGSSFSANMVLTVGNQNGSSVFNGVIQNTVPGFNNTPTVALTKTGTGTLTLTGANTYTLATTVNGGTLQVGNGTSGSLASTSPLVLGGGTFSLLGKTSGFTAQTLASLSLTAGTASSIVLNANGGSGTTLTLTSATITTGAGASVNFNYGTAIGATNGSTVGNDIVAWNPTLTSGIIGPGYTVTDTGGTGYATVISGKVIRLADPGSAGLPVTGGVSTTNYFVNQSYSTVSTSTAGSLVEALSGNVVANTVTVDTTGLASGANLALGANTLTLTSGGGITFSGANPYTITASGAGGLATSASAGAMTFNNFNSSTVTISAPILVNGANTVNFNGTGTTTLTGTSTYTGVTTINGGSTLQFGNGTTGNDGAISNSSNITDKGSLIYNIFGSTTYSGVISGAGSLTKNGTGTEILSAAGTYTGATTISNGTLTLGHLGFLNNTQTITINAGSTLNLAGTNTSTDRDQLLSGNQTTSALVINGTLANNGVTESRLYPATITMNNGTIACNLTSGDTNFGSFLDDIGNRTITANGASNAINGSGAGIGLGSTLTFNTPTTSDALAVSVQLGAASANAGSVVKTGAGTVTFSNANTGYTGTTTVNSGTLALQNTTAFNSATTVNAGGTLLFNNISATGDGNTGATINLNGGSLVYNTAGNFFWTWGGAVTASAVSTIDVTSVGITSAGLYFEGGLKGSAPITLTSHTNGLGLVLRLNNNTYSGTLTVNGTASTTPGTGSGLVIGDNGSNATLPNATIIVNGTMELGNNASGMGWAAGAASNGQTFQMDALSGTGVVVANMPNANSTRTLSVGNNNGTGSFSGVIASGTNDTLSFIKNGTGIQTLSGSSTYSGTTTIHAGSLVAGANSLASTNGAFGNTASAIVLGDATTAATDAPSLLINGAFTVSRAITVGTGATTAYNATIGGSNTSGTATYSGGVTLTNTGTYTTTLQEATVGTVNFTGAWTNAGNKAIAIGTSGNTGNVELTTSNLATTGGVNINFGTLLLGSANVLGITGTGTPVTVGSNGILDLNSFADNTFGAFTLNGGTLQSASGTPTLTATSYALNGGTIAASANLGGAATTVTVSNGTSSTTFLSGTEAGTTVNINSGTLSLGAANVLASGATVTLGLASTANIGTLDLHGNSQSVAALATTGTVPGSQIITSTTGSPTLTVTGNSSYAGQINGANLAISIGSGNTLTLLGSNAYAGATTISAGKLVLDHTAGTGALGGTAVSIGGSGTLLVKGTSSIASGGSLTTTASNANISLQEGTINTLNINGGLTLAVGSNLSFDIGSTVGSNDLIAATGAFSGSGTINLNYSTITNGNYTLLTASGGFTAGVGDFIVGTHPAGRITFSFNNSTATQEILTVSAPAFVPTAYWTGAASRIASDTANNFWSCRHLDQQLVERSRRCHGPQPGSRRHHRCDFHGHERNSQFRQHLDHELGRRFLDQGPDD